MDVFWDCCAPHIASGDAEPGTIMGGPCLRSKGQFVAMPLHIGPGLVVKLSRSRVDELIAGGRGEPFAPAGRVFREWVLVRTVDADVWSSLIGEAIEFGRRTRA